MRFLLWPFLFFSHTIFAISVEDFVIPPKLTCEQILFSGQQLLKDIDKYISDGQDINYELRTIEAMVVEKPECISFRKLKLSDQKIAYLRKYVYAPDKRYNLNETHCKTFTVDTSNMPNNRNQGPLGWCFAFTSADLLSFYEKMKLSSYDIAAHNHTITSSKKVDNKNVNYFDEGAAPLDALNLAILNSKGICLESETDFIKSDWLKLSTMIKNLHRSDKSLEQMICENQYNEKENFKDFSENTIRILEKLSPHKRVEAIFDLQCKSRHVLTNKYEAQYYSTEVPIQSKISQVDKMLAAGEPISITYDPEVLAVGINYVKKDRKINQNGEDETPYHASTVIGRRFNQASGLCEYQIRNSWGDNKHCKKTFTIDCEDGNFWVPRTTLMKNIVDMTWLTKK